MSLCAKHSARRGSLVRAAAVHVSLPRMLYKGILHPPCAYVRACVRMRVCAYVRIHARCIRARNKQCATIALVASVVSNASKNKCVYS